MPLFLMVEVNFYSHVKRRRGRNKNSAPKRKNLERESQRFSRYQAVHSLAVDLEAERRDVGLEQVLGGLANVGELDGDGHFGRT